MSDPEAAREHSRGGRASWAGRVLPAAVYLALVFVGGLLPGPALPATGGVNDKLAHLLAFAAAVPLIARAHAYLRPRDTPRKRLVVSAAVASAAGALLELGQAALPYRSAEVADLLADACGATAAALLLGLLAAPRLPPA
jgi:VanZ family protein